MTMVYYPYVVVLMVKGDHVGNLEVVWHDVGLGKMQDVNFWLSTSRVGRRGRR